MVIFIVAKIIVFLWHIHAYFFLVASHYCSQQIMMNLIASIFFSASLLRTVTSAKPYVFWQNSEHVYAIPAHYSGSCALIVSAPL